MRKEKEPEKSGEYRKLCIINHVQHEIYIELVEVSYLDEYYAGDEEAYIMDMYNYPKEYLEKNYVSWEWFIRICDYTDKRFGIEMPDIEKINKI